MFVTEPSRSFQRDVIAISTTAVGLLKGNERGEEKKKRDELGKGEWRHYASVDHYGNHKKKIKLKCTGRSFLRNKIRERPDGNAEWVTSRHVAPSFFFFSS